MDGRNSFPEPEHRTKIEKLLSPFEQFFQYESSSGIVLVSCMVIALAVVNFGWEHEYHKIIETHLAIGLEGLFSLDMSLHYWINDGLMALFFLLVGLEIKREVLVGELSGFSQALLPAAAALGGIVVPAGIYVAFNWGEPTIVGWGVPMATDIAFALGILAMMGKGVPLGLKVFLAALAIVDDICAVLVIALFYTADVAVPMLWAAAGVYAVLIAMNRLHVRGPTPYMIVGVLLWYFFFQSGVHATLAGVLLATAIPARVKTSPREFMQLAKNVLHRFESCTLDHDEPCVLQHHEQHSALLRLENLVRHTETPLQRIEHNILPMVTFVIVPIFALTNAGIVVDANVLENVTQPTFLGVFFGLVAGKPLGIYGASWLVLKTGKTRLPENVDMRHILAAGFLAGIGFTMSLFIAGLAFEQEFHLGNVKMAIIAASLLSWLLGWFVLKKCSFCKRLD